MKPILYLCALALVCGTNALAQAATVHVAQRLRSIECPKEIAKSGDDVRFGAMVATFRPGEAAANGLGVPGHAGKTLLLASAPFAGGKDRRNGGCVAVLDAVSGECLNVLWAPFPMKAWKRGREVSQYEDMQFGMNFALSPEGGFLFVGTGFGGKGFVMNLAKGTWFEITHPLMQICRVEHDRIQPNNNSKLNPGTNAVFVDEQTLYLVSETLTYHGAAAGSLAPGTLLFKVVFDPDKGVLSIHDPHKPQPTADQLAADLTPKRGYLTNRRKYPQGYGYRCDPQLDFHEGKLASTAFGIGTDSTMDVCAGSKHHFAACNAGSRLFVGEQPNQTPFLVRMSHAATGPRNRGDGIAVASDTNIRCYEQLEKAECLPGGTRPTGLGMIDRFREIGWFSVESQLNTVEGRFGLFRWDRVFEKRVVRLEVEASQPEMNWRAMGGPESGRSIDIRRTEVPWFFHHVDSATGLLYSGVCGEKLKGRRGAEPGQIHVFDLKPPLKELGWTEAAP
jgi:hypothetical protein